MESENQLADIKFANSSKKKKFKLKISQPILILSTGNAESLYPSMSYMLKQKNSRKFVSYRHITKNLIQLNPYEF
jgi:hypothetical protein